MTTDELRQAMERRNAELQVNGANYRLVFVAKRQKHGGLTGPCWAVACARCGGEVHALECDR